MGFHEPMELTPPRFNEQKGCRQGESKKMNFLRYSIHKRSISAKEILLSYEWGYQTPPSIYLFSTVFHPYPETIEAPHIKDDDRSHISQVLANT